MARTLLFLALGAACAGCAATPAPGARTASEGAPGSPAVVRVPSWAEGPLRSEEAVAGAPGRSTPSSGPLSRTVSLGEDAPPAPPYRGRRIDLDLKDAEVSEVCRLLADLGKANVVVAEDVKGKVTLRMRAVPWDEALDVIVRSKGYHVERTGSVLLVTAK